MAILILQVKKETAPETKQEPKEKTKIQENGTKSSDSKTEKDKLDNKVRKTSLLTRKINQTKAMLERLP